MRDLSAFKQQPTRFQVLQHLGICILDKLTRERICACQVASEINLLDKVQIILNASYKVDLTKSRSDMYDAGAIFHRDKIGIDSLV